MIFGTYNRLNLHVADSNLELIRRVRRMVHKTKRGRDARTMRHDLYRLLIEQHAKARALYVKVML
jgi:hypothetical protein